MGAAPSQFIIRGSACRKSPKGTTASENFTVTWRTCATSPCGLTLVMLAATAGAAATKAMAEAMAKAGTKPSAVVPQQRRRVLNMIPS